MMKKIRETLFVFKQNSAKLLSFWRDFFLSLKNVIFVKLCLHSSKTVRNSFHFDETFFQVWKTSKLCLRPQFWKSWLRTSLSLDPVKGFGTQSSSKFKFQLLKGKICLLPLEIFSIVFQCWKGRRRKRSAPEIGAYHLNYRFSVLMNLFKLSQQQKSWKKKINSAPHSVRHYRSTPTELQAPAE